MDELKELYRMEEKLAELSSLFLSIQTHGNKVDVEAATYGLNKIAFIQSYITRQKLKPKNVHLKRIYSGFSSLGRGVEFFTDVETNERFISKCKGLYEILEDLKQKINW